MMPSLRRVIEPMATDSLTHYVYTGGRTVCRVVLSRTNLGRRCRRLADLAGTHSGIPAQLCRVSAVLDKSGSENVFDLTHGQPFLRQPVPSFFKWRARCLEWSSVLCFGGLFYSGRMPIVIPGSDGFQSASARNPYRLPAGIVIGIERNMQNGLSNTFRSRRSTAPAKTR